MKAGNKKKRVNGLPKLGQDDPRLVLKQIQAESKGNPDVNHMAKPKQHPLLKWGSKHGRQNGSSARGGVALSLLVTSENTILFPRGKKTKQTNNPEEQRWNTKNQNQQSYLQVPYFSHRELCPSAML